jgi:hypothetical protein
MRTVSGNRAGPGRIERVEECRSPCERNTWEGIGAFAKENGSRDETRLPPERPCNAQGIRALNRYSAVPDEAGGGVVDGVVVLLPVGSDGAMLLLPDVPDEAPSEDSEPLVPAAPG